MFDFLYLTFFFSGFVFYFFFKLKSLRMLLFMEVLALFSFFKFVTTFFSSYIALFMLSALLVLDSVSSICLFISSNSGVDFHFSLDNY